jgi:DUF2892 family protein
MTLINESRRDRLIRLIVGLALGYAAWTTWPATAAVVYMVIAFIALVTGIVGWCPMYRLFGFSTSKKIGA